MLIGKLFGRGIPRISLHSDNGPFKNHKIEFYTTDGNFIYSRLLVNNGSQ